MAHLDISDPFTPQEGRLRVTSRQVDHEVRLSIAPVHDGPMAALRIFSSQRLFKPLTELGLSNEAEAAVDQMLRLQSGLILVTGPTGSGKTTTIYSLLRRLSEKSPNIVSIEDPVEYPLPFARQMAVDPRHGMTMTSGLKTVLRMDPDVVFLGEIRDNEAAEIAMRAASAGRLVFSTLHTRNAASTVTALRDPRIDNRSLGANVAGIISQRLVRRVCDACARSRQITDQEAVAFRDTGLEPPAELKTAMGCEKCRGQGFFDRIGVFEVAFVRDGIEEAIVNGMPESDFARLLKQMGVRSLIEDGLIKVAAGLTTFDEVRAALTLA